MSDVMRQKYRELSLEERDNMKFVKNEAAVLYDTVKGLGTSREISLALTKIEEACMWAVKHITS